MRGGGYQGLDGIRAKWEMKTMDNNKKTQDLLAGLAHFTGDLERYRSINRYVVYTPGVKYLADQAGAYWLIDAIASYFMSGQMAYPDPRLETLQFWRLDVNKDNSALLTARADSNVEPFITQRIEFTDFPLDQVDVWAGFDGRYWTLYLPSEH
jgi:hypothetical protein